ncbi:MAG TPA: PAS domain S-box protein [Steroidobacteraceae bacterium]
MKFAERLWEEIPDAVTALSHDGAILFWNEAATAIFGYSRSEALGRSLRDLTVPADLLEEDRASLQQILASGGVVYESVRRRKDGSLVHVSVAAKRVNSEAADYIVVTQKDVTHLKVQREAKLLEAKFRDLLEFTPDAIVMVNVTGHIVLLNSHAERMFLTDRQQLVGKPVETLLPERFHKAHITHRAGFFGQPRRRAMGAGLELFGLRGNGEEFPVEISLSPLVTDEGTVVMSAVRDISDRKRADRKFRDLLESAPDAMVIVGPDGKIALVNSQTERLFGYSREQLLGLPLETLVPPRFRDKHPAHRAGFFAGPRPRPMGEGLDLYGMRRDGTEFPVEISLSPLETEEGMFVSSAIRDATERKRAQQALQSASRMKSEFLANMSHELRTPLNGIIGFSEFLIDEKPGSLNARQKEYLSDILDSGRHLLQLVNAVLDLSKVEAGRMDVHPELFGVRKAVEEVCSVISPAAAQRSISIAHEVDASLEQVSLDRHKFVQVLYNLLSNAVKFTDEGGSTAVRIDRLPSGELRIRVSDTGIGIRQEDLDKLFVEFQQLDSGTTRRYQGTGLGLALTRKIVEYQRGTIAVESELGKGSLFTVTLPLAAADTLVS